MTATLNANPQELAQKFNAGDYLGLSQDIVHILDFFEQNIFADASANFIQGLEIMVDVLLQIFAAEKFLIRDDIAAKLIRHNGTFANMIHLTRFKNADATLRVVNNQQNNLVRMLILYSPYCTLRLPLEQIFTAQPYLASLWVSAILHHRWRGAPETYQFVQDVMASPALEKYTLDDKHFPLMEDTTFAYFDATYADPDKDRKLRSTINARTKELFQHSFKQGKNMKRILVISASMNVENSIYRCLAPLLYALKPDYHLSLFHITPEEQVRLDTQLFDDIKTMGVKNKDDEFTYEMLEKALAGDYGIVLFSDIGLSRPSVILSNLRLAPIQITTYGHPVTSGDTEVDYYIGGQAVEEKNNPQRHFGEQLVLMPGLGVEPVRLDYKPQMQASPRAGRALEIGLSWGDMKFNYPHLNLLKQIQEKMRRPIHFHFIGISATRLTLLNARRDLEAIFGAENIHVSPTMRNADYLKAIEACDLLLDSFHFGSYNRIVDCLTLHKPVVTLEGEKSYSRFASALLRQVGLAELTTTTSQEFVTCALRLINDEPWYEHIVDKIRHINLETALFNTGNARYFKNAIDTIVKLHQHGKEREGKAIIIPKN